jgi:hypothetical protein
MFKKKVSSESFTRHEFPALLATILVDEKAFYWVQTSKPSVVASPELFTVTSSDFLYGWFIYLFIYLSVVNGLMSN